jgi:Fur family peroxide stress response transcriptional regulator
MNAFDIKPRQSKYCSAIGEILARLGHATNAELLDELRKDYPELSATTVHRATARLAERGQISAAPLGRDGVMRYDANTTAHDHFQCQRCFMLRDADIRDAVVLVIQAAISDCEIGGRLVISGMCKDCKNEINEELHG